jgi:hypothetical protein
MRALKPRKMRTTNTIEGSTGSGNLMKLKDIRENLTPLMSHAMLQIQEAMVLATDDQYNRGLGWYSGANSECLSVSDKIGVDPDRFIGAVAALSPQMRWEMNIREAEKLAVDSDHKPPTFGKCTEKAKRILLGENPIKTLNGQKTTAFYCCIADPLGTNRVAIDRHQIRLMFPDKTDNFRHKMLEYFYPQMEEMHQELASKWDLRPHQVQAVTWNVQRESRKA